MGTFFIAGDRRSDSPSLKEILELDESVFELVYHSPSYSASLIIARHFEAGAAFWHTEHEKITPRKFFYDATGTGPSMVSVLGEDSPKMISLFDGQNYTMFPQTYFVCNEKMVEVISFFLSNGNRCECISWELETVIVERLGSLGCFDEIE